MKAISLLLFLLLSCATERPQRSQDSITVITHSRMRDYMECVKRSQTYQNYRRLQKRWRVIVEFTVTQGGLLENPTITNSDFEEIALHHCIIKEVTGLVFPTQKENIRVRQLLDLDPGEEK